MSIKTLFMWLFQWSLLYVFVNHVMMSMLFLTYLSVKIDYQDFHKKSEYYCETAFLNVQRTYIIVFSTIKLTAEEKKFYIDLLYVQCSKWKRTWFSLLQIKYNRPCYYYTSSS